MLIAIGLMIFGLGFVIGVFLRSTYVDRPIKMVLKEAIDNGYAIRFRLASMSESYVANVTQIDGGFCTMVFMDVENKEVSSWIIRISDISLVEVMSANLKEIDPESKELDIDNSDDDDDTQLVGVSCG